MRKFGSDVSAADYPHGSRFSSCSSVNWHFPCKIFVMHRKATQPFTAARVLEQFAEIEYKPVFGRFGLVLSFTLFVSSIFLLHPPALCAPKASSQSAKKVLELIQNHNLGGNQKLYLAKDAFRMENANNPIVVISRAPFTDVFLINPRKKMYRRRSTGSAVKSMMRAQMFAVVDDHLSEIDWGPGKDCKISGFNARTYLKKSPTIGWKKYSTLKEPVYPQPAIDFICANFGLPSLMGVPLKLEQLIVKSEGAGARKGGAKANVIFQTTSIKEKSFPDSFFRLPADFKPGKGTDLIDGAGNLKSLQDMMATPDFMFQSSKEKLRGDQLKKRRP